MVKTVFIYGLADPVTGVIKYIGKAKDLVYRYQIHTCPSHLKTNTPKNAWLKSLKEKPEMVLLDEVPEDTWQFWEQYWISQFKTWGFKLKNSTEGGEGNNITFRSAEFKKRVSSKLKGRPAPYVMTDVIRAKMSSVAKLAYKQGRKSNLTAESRKRGYDTWKKRIVQLDQNKNKIATFNTIKEAAQTLGNKSSGNLVSACKKGCPAYGFYWSYA